MTDTALGQFRIVDLSTHVAGPLCTKMFADYGSDVIKVELPGSGDPSRGIGPFFHDDPHPEKSLLFFYLNCNKQGVTLNPETVAGRNLLLSLIKDADALIESFPAGYLENLGLGYEELEKVNPGLVVTSITPFGQDGPHRDFAGNDLIYYAMSGMMYSSGAYHREPLKHGHPQSYYMGGMTAAYATSAALFSRAMTGQGQHIDLSLQESVAAHHYDSATRYSYTGTIERRAPKVESSSFKGTRFEGIVPSKDGFIAPTMQRGRPTAPFHEYITLLGHPELDDDRFDSRQLIAEHREELDEVLLPLLKKWDKAEYFNTFMSEGFVAGVVQTSEDLLNCPQLKERGYFTEVVHPVIGRIRVPGEMFRLPECPWAMRCPAPLLGQHNEAVYCDELGYTRKDLVAFRQLGII